MKDVLKGIGKRIKKHRLAANFTQEDLAGAAEIDRSYISELENGHKNPSVLTLYKIAAVLKIKPHKLLD
jgi:transcriptional regulator with XRE-family HTH domain